MTPEQYLEHLNTEAAQRSREQAQRMLGRRADTQDSSTPMPQARTADSEAATDAQQTGLSTTAQPADATTEPAAPSAPMGWGGRTVWATVAGLAGLISPMLGQLLAGNWMVFFFLLVTGDRVIDAFALSDFAADVGLRPHEVEQWITYALAGWAVLRVLMRGLTSSKDEVTPSPAR